MRTHLISSLSFILVALIIQSAPAAEAKPSPGNDAAALFDRLDANHDGQLTADEIPAEKKRLFERLLRLAGKPADGQLSRDEFIAQLKTTIEDRPSGPASTPAGSDKPTAEKPAAEKTAGEKPNAEKPPGDRPALDPERVFDRLDSKHTGKIALDDVPDERRQLIKRIFAEAGKSDGGSLTKEEFVKAFKALLAKRAAAGNPAAKPAADGKPGLGAKLAAGAGNGEQLFKRLLKQSKRSDGKLTKDDLPERLRDRFDKIDANHDGLIDETELRDWLAMIKSRLEAAQNK